MTTQNFSAGLAFSMRNLRLPSNNKIKCQIEYDAKKEGFCQTMAVAIHTAREEVLLFSRVCLLLPFTRASQVTV